jgi:hypothetical protein
MPDLNLILTLQMEFVVFEGYFEGFVVLFDVVRAV